MKWERECDSSIKTQLIEYNKSDCFSLMRLIDFMRQHVPEAPEQSTGGIVVRRTSLDAEYLLVTASAQFSPNTPAMLVAS